MRRWTALRDLPSPYQVVEGERGVLAVHEDYREALAEHGFGPDGSESLQTSALGGRRPLEEMATGEGRLLVRRFHHGGLLRWLNRDRFGQPERPFRELLLSHALNERGIDTPLVVAARAVRTVPYGWRLALVTRRIEGAIDAARVLERSTSLSQDRRGFLFRALGSFAGRLHRAGLFHRDLTPLNLLIDPGILEGEEGRLWILDLETARLKEAVSDAERSRDLARLHRHVRRRSYGDGFVLRPSDLCRFLQAYEAALEAPRTRWKTDWRRIERRARGGRLLHSTGWFLEDLFGGGPATRPGRSYARR